MESKQQREAKMTADEKTLKVRDLYHAGASLDAIANAIGTDDESLEIMSYQLGRSLKNLRKRYANEVTEV